MASVKLGNSLDAHKPRWTNFPLGAVTTPAFAGETKNLFWYRVSSWSIGARCMPRAEQFAPEPPRVSDNFSSGKDPAGGWRGTG
jgi:hypothetical protein